MNRVGEVEAVREVLAMVMAMDDTGLGDKVGGGGGGAGTGVEKLARTGTSRRLVEPTTTLRGKERDSVDDK